MRRAHLEKGGYKSIIYTAGSKKIIENLPNRVYLREHKRELLVA